MVTRRGKGSLKVLLVKSAADFLTEDDGIVPPLGLMHLSSYLKDGLKGRVDVSITDLRLRQRKTVGLEAEIRASAPDVVGVSALTLEAPAMFRVAKAAKEALPGVPVVAGGPHATGSPEKTLACAEIDIAVPGEGEEVFRAICGRVLAGKDPRGVPGAAHLEDGKVVLTPHKHLPDPETLPFPDWGAIDIDAYARRFSMCMLGRRRYMALFTSRGCPFHCTYCHKIFGKRFRARSPGSVVAEIDELVSRHDVRSFEIIDDIFNLDYGRAEKIMDLIIGRRYGLEIAFPNGLRIDLLDDNLLVKMREAGTAFISMPVETATPEMQGRIGKRLDLDKAARAIRVASRLGIITNGFFMVGFPGETEEQIHRTIAFAVDSALTTADFFTVIPFEHTRLQEQCSGKEKMDGTLVSDDMQYQQGRSNFSGLSDRKFFALKAEAYSRFYGSPRRALRLFRAYHGTARGIPILFDYWPQFQGNMVALVKNIASAALGRAGGAAGSPRR